MAEKPIYLDYNATTPIDPEVADAMLPFLKEHFGNPSSSHWYGVQTRQAVENARKQVAELLGCFPDEVIFTSGGSESNNFAIKGVAYALRDSGKHIITSQIEHPAVINVCKWLEKEGFRVTYVPVDEYGLVDPEDVRKAITAQTILITIMHANNEVGTIQPISEISKIARGHDIVFHTDAAQSVGKIPARVQELGVDLLSIAGHKIYAPKGVGALYMRRGVKVEKLVHGADHEQDRRAGTENVLEIVGLGKAAEIAGRDPETKAAHMRKMRDRLWDGLRESIPGLILNGHPEKRLPNTLSVAFPGIDANTLLSELDEVAASPGAACHFDATEPSPVLVAMKVPRDAALGTIRFSTGRHTTEEETDRAVEAITRAVGRLSPGAEAPVAEKVDLKEIKLTHYTHGLGCACKLRPQALEEILGNLPPVVDPNVIVGTTTADDAAVYRLKDGTAIVQTVDFFTPVVDEPYDFGAIAAANSLSDIYAMGGRPLFALSIVGFPEKRLPLQILEEILRGAHDKAKEAGISILGGHTVEDNEPKFGLVVTGIIDPDNVLTNDKARPGDAIILTKPIGLGIISTAIKRGMASADLAKKAVKVMSALNRDAAEAMLEVGAHACTDVTGFGLLGHLKEMTRASKADAVIYASKVPVIKEAWDLAAAGAVPGGTLSNMDFLSDTVEWDESVSTTSKLILCDAQTSGGLIIAVPAGKKNHLLKVLKKGGVIDSVEIGEFTVEGEGRIAVKPQRITPLP
ncbi:MAG: selenide, water dikinase SelD [candidate division Zixibacteria bacterium]|nr:selenide, water dikinase SelD [candidate division Zixibacteria bacterium]